MTDYHFHIHNRRYIGSKYKLMPWIKKVILENCPEHKVIFDIFGGTGVFSAGFINVASEIVINDILYSNEVIYRAFFSQEVFNPKKLEYYAYKVAQVDSKSLPDNYVSINYGGKFFCVQDAKLIGYIREDIETLFMDKRINKHEYTILLASLLYSFDRCANTVGHYDAYIKTKKIPPAFHFDLVLPVKTDTRIYIYRQDANELVHNIYSDVAFVDPPYNSRQYSRFYHLPETIIKWDKPVLSGTAMKPPRENMSDYCRNSAPKVFEDLIMNLNTKYIVVTYNNTYDSKSSSSRNKIALEEIKTILEKRGATKIFLQDYHRFNAGKTDRAEHKEILFVTECDE